MSETIRFSVHRNPKTDASAPDTFHVRHEALQTVGRELIQQQLKDYRGLRETEIVSVLNELPEIIVQNLLDNRNVHINGLGTFFLRLGFRPQGDDDNPVKPHFQNPAAITGNNVQIEGINFKPDKEFLQLLFKDGHHFENATGRGQVGHSSPLDAQQVRQFITGYLAEHPYLTRRILQLYLNLTRYAANQWLDRLSVGPDPLLKGEQLGRTYIYTLRR